MRNQESRGEYPYEEYADCNFMRSYGGNCSHDGCWAKKLKKNPQLNSRAVIGKEERQEIKAQIEQAAASAGCPNYSTED